MNSLRIDFGRHRLSCPPRHIERFFERSLRQGRASARQANALLLTRDRRASATYEKIGVRFELVE